MFKIDTAARQQAKSLDIKMKKSKHPTQMKGYVLKSFLKIFN